MSDIERKALESSGLALWSAYCDKKMELEDAQDRIEALEKTLRIAAGYISTKEGHTHQHPQEVYEWLIAISDAFKDENDE